MAVSTSIQSGSPGASRPGQAIVVKRLRFVEQAPPGAIVLREYRQPRPCVAIAEALQLSELSRTLAWPEPTDELVVVLVPKNAAAEWQNLGSSWLAPPNHPDAVPAVSIERDGVTVRWRPGRAVVTGRLERAEGIVAALADFAFYEGELRDLEASLEPYETRSEEDATRAHRIRMGNREHWDRFATSIEFLSQMRLRSARLDPHLAKGSRTLPVEARRWMSRLLVRADVPARVESFSDRLEACEDLYEGANDRVADYRWYRVGHRIELGILGLLVIEVVLLALDLLVRYLEFVE